MAEGGSDPRQLDGPAKYGTAARANQVCRFYLQGRCSKGAGCMFSHNKSKKTRVPENVCRFYQLDRCMYGDKCRYEHRKLDDPQDTVHHTVRQTPQRSDESNHITSRMVTLKKGGFENKSPDQAMKKKENETQWVMASEFVPGQKYHGSYPSSYANAVQPGDAVMGAESWVLSKPPQITEHSLICPFFEHDARCPNEGSCPYAHPLICDMCGLPRLHPQNKEQQDQHIKECIEAHKKEMDLAFAIQASKDKECGICLENVIEKEGDDVKSGDRRFGILENCNHCFCLPCIRTWRHNRSAELQTQRTCPTCRTHSDFVTPSKYWVESQEEKKLLISDYREAMSRMILTMIISGRGVLEVEDWSLLAWWKLIKDIKVRAVTSIDELLDEENATLGQLLHALNWRFLGPRLETMPVFQARER